MRPLVAAVLTGADVAEAAAALGARYAAEGEGLELCLADLDETLRTLRAEPAPAPVVRAAALAWADTTQGHYNLLTCRDPFTGLASLQHLQAHLDWLYAAAADGALAVPDVPASRTLVVLDLPVAASRDHPHFGELESAIRAAACAELLAEQLPGAEQPAQLNSHRVVAVARRSPALPSRLAELARRLDGRLALSPSGGRCAVWTEAMPADHAAARRLVDDLAR
jgi:hypothetical protein